MVLDAHLQTLPQATGFTTSVVFVFCSPDPAAWKTLTEMLIEYAPLDEVWLREERTIVKREPDTSEA
ncbi:hypothetical protein JG687_00008000 [Phytophthora cactorum]|uniref:Uncharacterized protein n=1 Tax=Phytophthora cactorum TaxID=29920 RepID=A0A8T1UDK7_9STRA|nr:hypothetical protein JG687_00008000 [Phytophthora cactorum]